MKGFTDDERARIRRDLLDAGRELFARYGLAKTTIADLTEPAGIANSTFYQFFDSKERLYLEILEAEGEEAAERLISNSLEAETDPRAAIAAFLRLTIEEIETNPLVRRLLVEDELDRLRRTLTEAERAEARERKRAFLVPYVERWQRDGIIREGDPAVMAETIRAATFIALHREDVGEEYYPAVRDMLVETVAAGLTRDD